MTTFLGPDEATNVDLADSRHRRDQDRVACFLHLRDLVYLHPGAASASAVAFVQTLEAKVIAEKATREKRLADARDEHGERRIDGNRPPSRPLDAPAGLLAAAIERLPRVVL
jgi:hypothetical protein